MTLLELYNKHKVGDWPDKNSTHSYIPFYEYVLAPYRHTAKNILEIGLMSGESLRMWDEYFDGEVYGIDCDIKPINGMADLTNAISEGYKIKIGDASDPTDIAKYFRGIMFDVVIEDAGHSLGQQLSIYLAIKPYLNKGAIYIVEDIQNIDASAEVFLAIDPEKEITIMDLRSIKERYDDCLVIIKDKP